MKIVIAINYVNYTNEIKKGLQDVALSVLIANKPRNVSLVSLNYENEKVNVPEPIMVFNQLKRDSQRELGNNRRLPFIKEIFDTVSKLPCDIFGYMNSDILLNKDFFKFFSESYGSYVFYKKDIEKISANDFLKGNIRVVDDGPYGIDAFFFKREWWHSNRKFFPDDLILGETEWDTCYNSIIQKVDKKYFIGRCLYHVIHERIWSLSSRGAVNNTLIWQRVRDTYGLPSFASETKERQ